MTLETRKNLFAIILSLLLIGCGGGDNDGPAGANVPVEGVWIGEAGGYLVYFSVTDQGGALTGTLSYPDEFLGSPLIGSVRDGRIHLEGKTKDLTFNGTVTKDLRVEGTFRMYYESNSGPYTEEKGQWWADIWPTISLGPPARELQFVSMSPLFTTSSDGQRIWAAMPFGGVSEYNTDLEPVGTPSQGELGNAITFDGAVLWTTEQDKLRAVGGDQDDIALAFTPHGLAHDGTAFWSCDDSGQVHRFGADGVVTRSVTLPQSFACDALAHDGTHLYALVETYVVKIDPANGHRLAAINIKTTSPMGIALAQDELWVLERHGALSVYVMGN